MDEAQRLAREAQDYFSEADREGRELTHAERHRVQACLDGVKRIQADQQFSRLNGMPDVMSDGSSSGGGPGDRFVASKGWKSISDPASRGQTWTTGQVDVGFQTKAGTVLESGQGAGFTITPQVAPGVVSKLFQQLGVADAFSQAQTTASSVRYITEGTATSGAAGVAEAGTKPASDLAFSTVDEPVKKIATVLTISDEILEDAVSIQSYLNSRLNLFVTIEEERQLLRGSGTNELVGVMDSTRGINTYTKLATDDNAVALLKVLNNTRGSSFVEPEWIIMHPSNWLTTRLLRDGTGGTVGQFYGGGPFSAAYGGGGGATMAGAFVDTLWNKPVILSTVVGAGTALVGSSTSAQIYRRGGRTVEASNQHASYFQSNLVMLRSESRQAFCLYRPSAFTEVRGLA